MTQENPTTDFAFEFHDRRRVKPPEEVRALLSAEADASLLGPGLTPLCEYCARIKNAPTDHYPITRLKWHERLSLSNRTGMIISAPFAGMHVLGGKDVNFARKVASKAMARGDYSWVEVESCKIESALCSDLEDIIFFWL